MGPVETPWEVRCSLWLRATSGGTNPGGFPSAVPHLTLPSVPTLHMHPPLAGRHLPAARHLQRAVPREAATRALHIRDFPPQRESLPCPARPCACARRWPCRDSPRPLLVHASVRWDSFAPRPAHLHAAPQLLVPLPSTCRLCRSTAMARCAWTSSRTSGARATTSAGGQRGQRAVAAAPARPRGGRARQGRLVACAAAACMRVAAALGSTGRPGALTCQLLAVLGHSAQAAAQCTIPNAFSPGPAAAAASSRPSSRC